MRYSILDRGLLREDQLKKISYLSFSRESKQITALLTQCVRKLRQYQRISFFLESLSTLILFLILSFIPILLLQTKPLIVFLAMIYIVFHALVIFFRLVKLHYLHKYIRVTQDLGDNLLSVIFDDYKLSLGDKLPEVYQVKGMVQDIAEAAEASREYQRFVREVFGVVFGLLVLLALGFSLKFMLFLHVAVLVSVILLLFAVHSLLEAMHSAFELDYEKEHKNYDESFTNSHPLLTRTTLDFDRNTYLENEKPAAILFDNINIVNIVNKSLLPVLLLFLPLILGDIAGGVYLLVVGLFISNRLFSVQNPVLNRAKTKKGERRLDQLDNYLDTIINKGSEITPTIYKELQKELIAQNPKTRIGDRIIWGDLIIKNLSYYTGWSKNKKQIFVDDISLPFGKVSFLVGDYGVGKTLFGRVATLRYSNFSADQLSIGNKDLRTFRSLDEALRYLHLSSKRNISTSYRNALSVYLRDAKRANLLVKKIMDFDGDAQLIEQHFKQNKSYYGNLHTLVAQVLGSGKVDPEYFKLAADLYQNFSYQKNTYQTLKELKEEIDENVFNKALAIAAMAEYLSFKHLKNYVPEASLFFMDVVLSEPPISEEMKLRFLYSLDVFMEGLVLVVDEPFKQLKEENASRVLDDLVEYAKNYNAIVIILDEKLYYEIIEKHKGQNVLGKIMRFEDDGFSMVIRSNDME